MLKYLVALDQGTTSSRAVVFDKNARIVKTAHREYGQYYPKPLWVEQDGMEILSSQLAALKEALRGLDVGEVAALGIANQRETALIWERDTGRPIHNAIGWQCRRTADFCAELKKRGLEDVIKQKTGLLLDPYFSAAKFKWLLDNVDGARKKAEAGDLLAGTIDTWLMWNLTGGAVFATDFSNASRTMLFNIHTHEWDGELLSLFDIPRSILPEVKPSNSVFGVSYVDGLEIPIAGVAGDQQAALFGQQCFEEGLVKNTYGTGCFVLMNTGGKVFESAHNLISTIAWNLDGKVTYALEGSVFSGGSCVKWLRDSLKIVHNAASSEDDANSVDSTLGVYLVPAFTGLGAPYWKSDARGVITGLTSGVRREHIVRSALEAIAYQSRDVIKAMEEDAGFPIKALRVDGGASANGFLMQFQADILDCRVERPHVLETTALGAASLAGLGSNFYKTLPNTVRERIFKPSMDSARREKLLTGWKKAVELVLGA